MQRPRIRASHRRAKYSCSGCDCAATANKDFRHPGKRGRQHREHPLFPDSRTPTCCLSTEPPSSGSPLPVPVAIRASCTTPNPRRKAPQTPPPAPRQFAVTTSPSQPFPPACSVSVRYYAIGVGLPGRETWMERNKSNGLAPKAKDRPSAGPSLKKTATRDAPRKPPAAKRRSTPRPAPQHTPPHPLAPHGYPGSRAPAYESATGLAVLCPGTP